MATDKSAICPFFKEISWKDGDKSKVQKQIKCEGLSEGGLIYLTFNTREERNSHREDFCRSACYEGCPIAIMLKDTKYPPEKEENSGDTAGVHSNKIKKKGDKKENPVLIISQSLNKNKPHHRKENKMKKENLIYIPVEKIHPHQDNPRKDLGDLTELAESIKAKGVLQNLTVVPFVSKTNPKFNGAGLYTVIIGHRRLAAAKLAGVDELPCIVTEMSEQDQVATMLLENIQRSDLTVYEQAQGFRQLSMDFGMSAASIAEKTGFSQSTVRRRLKIADLNQDILKDISGRQISMADLERVSKIEDPKLQDKALKDIGTASFVSSCTNAEQEQKKRNNIKAWKEICLSLGLEEIAEGLGNKRDKYDNVSGTIYSATPSEKQVKEYTEKKENKGKKLYFYTDRWGYLYIVTPASKTPSAKKADPNEEKRRKANEAIKYLGEAGDRAYSRRLEFIESMNDSVDFSDAIADFVKLAVEISEIDYFELDRETLFKFMGYDSEFIDEEEEEPIQWSHIADAVKQNPLKHLVLVMISSINDRRGRNLWYPSYQDKRGQFNKTCSDLKYLKALYAFLEKFGYGMSEEEKSLLDGTNEHYIKGE